MRIVVNTRLLQKDRLEGIGVFSCEILKRITLSHPEHEFVFLFDRPFAKEFIFAPNVIPVVRGPQTRHPFLFYYWFEFVVPNVLKEFQADLFLSPDGFLSLSTEVKSIAVIHDLNFEHADFNLSFLQKNYYRRYFPLFARKAKRILTVSEFSKKDIVKQYQIPAEKIDVAHNAAGEGFRPLSEIEREAARKKYSGSKPFFLYVGAIHQRKNIAGLLNAFEQFRAENGGDVKLVLAGSKKGWNDEMQHAFDVMKFRNEVIFTGHVLREELYHIMGSALALVYIPFFEGFGIPVVEAMYSEIPVIASNTSSLPEICGDAALLVNPENTNEIATAMKNICNDQLLAYSLIEKAKSQRKKFSWDDSAALVWSCMKNQLNS